MAGQASGGQQLTPNRNVTAPAGRSGQLWGANGGGITPIGGGVSGQQGWDAPVAQTLADGETAANYLIPKQSAESQESVGALPGFTHDDSLPSGGSNAG